MKGDSKENLLQAGAAFTLKVQRYSRGGGINLDGSVSFGMVLLHTNDYSPSANSPAQLRRSQQNSNAQHHTTQLHTGLAIGILEDQV